MGRSARLALSLLLAAVVGGAAPAAAQRTRDLVVDLSKHEVAVAVDFAGADLVLFGTAETKGDVVVEVRGPLVNEVVRRKARIAGVWINRDEMVFAYVPAFYALAANRPIDAVLRPAQQADERIGVDHLGFIAPEGVLRKDTDLFRQALVRNKQKAGLYPVEQGKVVFVGERLFRTDIHFPANAPVGSYQVAVHLFRDGRTVGTTRTPLILSRAGFEAALFRLAHENSWVYGFLAVAIAIVSGWLANVFFRSKA